MERALRQLERETPETGLGIGQALELPLALAKAEENLVQGRRWRLPGGESQILRQGELVEAAAEEAVGQQLALTSIASVLAVASGAAGAAVRPPTGSVSSKASAAWIRFRP